MARWATPDEGLAAAFAAAGGRSALARRLGVGRTGTRKWSRCPRDRLFAVARAAGMLPEDIRPDLAEWIGEERRRQRAALAATRYSIAGRAPAASRPEVRTAGVRALPPTETPAALALAEDVAAWGVTVAAVRFAAAERGLEVAALWRGSLREALSARAYAMALAHVAGRLSPRDVAAVFGVSRQNVDNAALRYLRARDGDPLEDTVDGRGLQVLEGSRLRPAKACGDEALWAAERRFLAVLAGEEAAPEPIRRRA